MNVQPELSSDFRSVHFLLGSLLGSVPDGQARESRSKRLGNECRRDRVAATYNIPATRSYTSTAASISSSTRPKSLWSRSVTTFHGLMVFLLPRRERGKHPSRRRLWASPRSDPLREGPAQIAQLHQTMPASMFAKSGRRLALMKPTLRLSACGERSGPSTAAAAQDFSIEHQGRPMMSQAGWPRTLRCIPKFGQIVTRSNELRAAISHASFSAAICTRLHTSDITDRSSTGMVWPMTDFGLEKSPCSYDTLVRLLSWRSHCSPLLCTVCHSLGAQHIRHEQLHSAVLTPGFG